MNKFYSEEVPKILDVKERTVIGKQILAILKIHLGDLSKLKLLDFGCSSGVITNVLSKNFKKTIGVDIDRKAIKQANKAFESRNLKFVNTNKIKTPFKSDSFDVIVVNQVYEFVESDVKLMDEIYRLLKKGGVCFFGARNKYALIEAQYNIPFLSWLPFQLPWFVGRYRSYFGLKKLVKSFVVRDYTIDILRNPKKYGYGKLEKYRKIAGFLPLNTILPLIPNYIWILEKK